MNPVCVIASQQRLEITTANIKSLQAQSYVPQIVVVVSEPSEAKHYIPLGVHVVQVANHPLGRKWQAGVNYARSLNPSHLIINGSDDILCKDFIRRFCTGVDFIGLQQWYVLNDGKLYLFDYLASQALGGGRVYSKRLLDTCNWNIFDTGASKLLDDRGWLVTRSTHRCIIEDEGCILAVKGNWPTLNPLNIKHRNVMMTGCWEGEEAATIVKEKFGYEY